ncbi:unnamed protein product [Parnassius mnemosyne]|uniref:Uncharacterized protein n=1 Tax=Parnassius mnemosyne TaxID=213953 RepID=A0AAV1KHW9_9NEOP
MLVTHKPNKRSEGFPPPNQVDHLAKPSKCMQRCFARPYTSTSTRGMYIRGVFHVFSFSLSLSLYIYIYIYNMLESFFNIASHDINTLLLFIPLKIYFSSWPEKCSFTTDLSSFLSANRFLRTSFFKFGNKK